MTVIPGLYTNFHRVEGIDSPLTQKVRYLGRLVGKLAKRKKMVSILRS